MMRYNGMDYGARRRDSMGRYMGDYGRRGVPGSGRLPVPEPHRGWLRPGGRFRRQPVHPALRWDGNKKGLTVDLGRLTML